MDKLIYRVFGHALDDAIESLVEEHALHVRKTGIFVCGRKLSEYSCDVRSCETGSRVDNTDGTRAANAQRANGVARGQDTDTRTPVGAA